MTTSSISSFAIDPGLMRRCAQMDASSKAPPGLSRQSGYYGQVPCRRAGRGRSLYADTPQASRACSDGFTLLNFGTARQQLALVGNVDPHVPDIDQRPAHNIVIR